MNAHNNRKPIGQAHHARKAIATTATGAIVAALIVGLTVLPVEGVRADTAQVSNVEVRETVSPKQIVQYCPAQMGLADTEAFGDTEFQSSVGNLQSRRRYAAFGSIFHAQSRNLTDADGVDAAVLESPTQDDGTVAYVSSAQSAKDPSVLETRVLSAQSGTGATGALASWATEGDLPGVAASSFPPSCSSGSWCPPPPQGTRSSSCSPTHPINRRPWTSPHGAQRARKSRSPRRAP
jgi:hypothetical protein